MKKNQQLLLEDGSMFAGRSFGFSKAVVSEVVFNTAADFLRAHTIETTVLHWPLDEKSPNTTEYLGQGKIDLVINIPKNYQEEELTNDYIIRRHAVDSGIPLITNIQLAQRFVEAISNKQVDDLKIKSWSEYERF